MADISSVKTPDGTLYNIKDATARENITTLTNRTPLLTYGTSIEAGTDLDDLMTIGAYGSIDTATTNTLIHCPVTGSGLRLYVTSGTYNSTTYLEQWLDCYTSGVYRRYKRGPSSNWTEWTEIATTDIIDKTFFLDDGTTLAASTDLNILTTVGNYRCTATDISTMQNCPISGHGFRLWIWSTLSNWLCQDIRTLYNEHYYRYRRSGSGTTWTEWYKDPTEAKDVGAEPSENTFQLNPHNNIIAANTDLNDLVQPNCYGCPTSAITKTLLNCPISAYGFRLYVNCMAPHATDANIDYVSQWLFSEREGIYVRYKTGTSSSWSDWNFAFGEGGRNLVTGTKGTFTEQVSSTSSAMITNYWPLTDYGKQLANDEVITFTISFEAKSTVAEDVISFSLRSNAASEIKYTSLKSAVLTTEWKRYTSIIYLYNSGITATRLWGVKRGATTSSTISIRNIKLERGVVCTDWTLAPEEIETDIATAQSTADGVRADLTTTQNELNNLVINGRNLFIATTRTNDKYIASSGNVNSWSKTVLSDYIAVKEGDTVIIQCWKPENTSATSDNRGYYSIATYDNSKKFKTRPKYEYFTSSYISYNYTVTAEVAYIRVSYHFGVDGPVGANWDPYEKFRIKIERGTTPTEWSIAPEDLDMRIQQVCDKVQTNNKNLLLDTNAPTLSKVAAPSNRQFVNNYSYITPSYVQFNDAPLDIKYGARFVVTSTGTGNRNLRFYNSSKIKLINGNTYTASCYARIVNCEKMELRPFYYVSTTVVAGSIDVTSTTWERYNFTFTYDAASCGDTTGTGAYFYFGGRGTYIGTLEICGFKLEEGNLGTEWSLAPGEQPYVQSGRVEITAQDSSPTLMYTGSSLINFPITYVNSPPVIVATVEGALTGSDFAFVSIEAPIDGITSYGSTYIHILSSAQKTYTVNWIATGFI